MHVFLCKFDLYTVDEGRLSTLQPLFENFACGLTCALMQSSFSGLLLLRPHGCRLPLGFRAHSDVGVSSYRPRADLAAKVTT